MLPSQENLIKGMDQLVFHALVTFFKQGVRKPRGYISIAQQLSRDLLWVIMGLRDAILVDCITFTSQQGSELVANLNKASKELTQLWNTTLKSFTACLCKSLEKNNLSNTLDDLICYSAPPSVMIPLTGYLLGYPVVYCYLFHPSPPMHHTLPDACYPVPPKNCLSGLELVVIKASIKAQPEFLDFQK
ncbi:hypothetical protein DSO57_1034612 [Entomophthora muscae]|uniref:Uncharacterized protein n=1 Tax=Entomophthora muscae TaxID=34485 RepID=A0ACC2TXP0_9FUNG|nr:hypothetical protein DSO57_1034612 [Entomophthora muscae]